MNLYILKEIVLELDLVVFRTHPASFTDIVYIVNLAGINNHTPCFLRHVITKPCLTVNSGSTKVHWWREGMDKKPHDDVINLKHFPRYWPFVRGIYRPPVYLPHTGQWRGALMLCLICSWTNGWAKNRDAGDLRRHHAHHDVTVMSFGMFAM